MAEQDPRPGSMAPLNARVASMLGSAEDEDVDSSMPIAAQAGLEQHTKGSFGYPFTYPPGYIENHPQLVESCPPYPFRSGPNFRAYHAQKAAAWTPDGKCVLQLGEDKCLRTHSIFPPPSHLTGVHEPPEAITAFAASPYFESANPESMLVLASVKEEPMRLFNVNGPGSQLHASYPLLYETDDVLHISVDCIKFLPDNIHFVAAGNNCLAFFDITRYSSEPVVQLYTHSKYRKKNRRDPLALGGRISTLDYRSDGLLAVGTWANRIGFYEDCGRGEVLAVEHMSDTCRPNSANGIQTVRWSPNGSYLYVAERDTDSITILDVRMAGRKVSFLTGRNAKSMQRHGLELTVDGNGHHVIAGGCDGVVRVWHNPTTRTEENTGPDVEWQAHDDHIAAVAINPIWPDFLITTAGSRHFPPEEDYNTNGGSDMGDDSSEGDSVTIGDSSEKNSVTADNGNEDEPRRGGGAKELDAPVPKGWMKLWRW